MIRKHIRIGSSASLTVQLFDGDTDVALPLSGYTSWSGNARHTLTGDVVSFSAVTVVDAANGKLKLDRTVGAFTVAGDYSVDLMAYDATGKPDNFPHRRGSLLIAVGEANV